MKTEIFKQIFEVKGKDFGNAGKASTTIKTILKDLGINPQIIRRVGIACYEAEMNMVMYALQGTIEIQISPSMIVLFVDDKGPGIPDINLAMQEGFSTATEEIREMGFGAGMGLPNIKKNSDTLKILSEVNKGTRLEIGINLN